MIRIGLCGLLIGVVSWSPQFIVSLSSVFMAEIVSHSAIEICASNPMKLLEPSSKQTL